MKVNGLRFRVAPRVTVVIGPANEAGLLHPRPVLGESVVNRRRSFGRLRKRKDPAGGSDLGPRHLALICAHVDAFECHRGLLFSSRFLALGAHASPPPMPALRPLGDCTYRPRRARDPVQAAPHGDSTPARSLSFRGDRPARGVRRRSLPCAGRWSFSGRRPRRSPCTRSRAAVDARTAGPWAHSRTRAARDRARAVAALRSGNRRRPRGRSEAP
jgi:hypothetical protein